MAMLALLYIVSARASAALSLRETGVAAIWYANAIAIAFLLQAPAPMRRWLWTTLAASLWLSNYLWNGKPSLALVFVAPNLAEIASAVWLLRRAGLQQADLRSLRQMLALLLGGGVGAVLVGASVAALLLHAIGWPDWRGIWLSWFEGSAIGACSTLPLALLLLRQPPARSWSAIGGWRPLLLWAPLAVLLAAATMHFSLPGVFIHISLPLLAAASALELLFVALLTMLVSVTGAAMIGLGLYVMPHGALAWKAPFVYLGLAAALVPAQLLSAAVMAMRDKEAGLRQREAELRRAHERLEQFVHIAAHDLREPLNTVQQFSGLIADDHGAALPPPARRYLDLVRDGAARMRELLDDVLLFARLPRSALEHSETVALAPLWAALQQQRADELRRSGAQLRIGALPAVRGQRDLLAQVFEQLLDNALKFMPEGRAPAVEVGARSEHGRVIVTVADNGIGIAADELGTLFRPFRRLHPRSRFEGSGLGLALARQIVDLHGGRIDVESTPGEGSRFEVELPAA